MNRPDHLTPHAVRWGSSTYRAAALRDDGRLIVICHHLHRSAAHATACAAYGLKHGTAELTETAGAGR